MTSRHPIVRLLIVLCAFAVLGVQVFGVARGFACDCGGTQRIVKTDGCNGPHGANCHADDSQQDKSQQQPGSHDEGGGDRKEHKQVKEDLTGTNATVPPVVIPSPVILAVLPELLLLAPKSLSTPLEFPADAYGSPPLSMALARTVVLRI